MKKNSKRKRGNKKIFLIALMTVIILIFLLQIGINKSLRGSEDKLLSPPAKQSEPAIDYVQQEKKYLKIITDSEGKDVKAFSSLAKVYLLQKKYDEAVTLIENIKYVKRKSLLKAKFNFYKFYSECLYDEGEYSKALEMYEKAILNKKMYTSKISLKKIREKKFDLYIKLAQKTKKEGKKAETINWLNKALNCKKTAELYNDFALLYFDSDLSKSVEYFELAKLQDPNVINFDIYLNAVSQLKHQSENTPAGYVYTLKEGNLKHFINNFVTHPNDFTVVTEDIKVSSHLFSSKKEVAIKFKLKNSTNYIINNVFVKTEIVSDGKIITTDEFTLTKPIEHLPPQEITDTQTIKFKTQKENKNFICNYYATKNKKAPMKLIFIQNIALD